MKILKQNKLYPFIYNFSKLVLKNSIKASAILISMQVAQAQSVPSTDKELDSRTQISAQRAERTIQIKALRQHYFRFRDGAFLGTTGVVNNFEVYTQAMQDWVNAWENLIEHALSENLKEKSTRDKLLQEVVQAEAKWAPVLKAYEQLHNRIFEADAFLAGVPKILDLPQAPLPREVADLLASTNRAKSLMQLIKQKMNADFQNSFQKIGALTSQSLNVKLKKLALEDPELNEQVSQMARRLLEEGLVAPQLAIVQSEYVQYRELVMNNYVFAATEAFKKLNQKAAEAQQKVESLNLAQSTKETTKLSIQKVIDAGQSLFDNAIRPFPKSILVQKAGMTVFVPAETNCKKNPAESNTACQAMSLLSHHNLGKLSEVKDDELKEIEDKIRWIQKTYY